MCAEGTFKRSFFWSPQKGGQGPAGRRASFLVYIINAAVSVVRAETIRDFFGAEIGQGRPHRGAPGACSGVVRSKSCDSRELSTVARRGVPWMRRSVAGRMRASELGSSLSILKIRRSHGALRCAANGGDRMPQPTVLSCHLARRSAVGLCACGRPWRCQGCCTAEKCIWGGSERQKLHLVKKNWGLMQPI